MNPIEEANWRRYGGYDDDDKPATTFQEIVVLCGVVGGIGIVVGLILIALR